VFTKVTNQELLTHLDNLGRELHAAVSGQGANTTHITAALTDGWTPSGATGALTLPASTHRTAGRARLCQAIAVMPAAPHRTHTQHESPHQQHQSQQSVDTSAAAVSADVSPTGGTDASSCNAMKQNRNKWHSSLRHPGAAPGSTVTDNNTYNGMRLLPHRFRKDFTPTHSRTSPTTTVSRLILLAGPPMSKQTPSRRPHADIAQCCNTRHTLKKRVQQTSTMLKTDHAQQN
jgi:hypothetical protein